MSRSKNYAGLAQLASDKDGVKFFKNKSNGNFGDNEGDASAIQDGIDSYEENNKWLTRENNLINGI